ncbi:MAG: ABC transporter substrate-binding protein [Rikenellaceae bacterium]
MLRKFFSLLLFISIAIGCSQNSSFNGELESVEISHAKCFRIFKGEGYKTVELINPWDTTKLLNRYVLVSKSDNLPDSLPQGVVVRTPIENIVVNTVVDGSIIELLGCDRSISAVCEAQYFKNPKIRKRIDNGEIVNLGQSSKPSIEKIIALHPEAIVATAFQNTGFGALEKLNTPIIQAASYMESAQLGQSEWIKYFAAFLEKEQIADSIFSAIESRYNSVRDIAKNSATKPQLMQGKRFGSAWYFPAGGSYKTLMFLDAGASYPWSETTGEGSLSLSYEEVLTKSRDADYWIIVYNNPNEDLTYSSLKKEFEGYANFKPFKEQKIFGCNSAYKDYYESVIFSPDLLLCDYIKILHPELLEDYKLNYFKPLGN